MTAPLRHAKPAADVRPLPGGSVIALRRSSLTLHFARPQRTASWAIVGGGLRRSDAVVWYQVGDLDLRPPVDPVALLRQRLQAAGLPNAVGLLTSRALDSFTTAHVAFAAWSATCVATVGLGNALRAGDLPGAAGRIGTINITCQVSQPLSDNALLEALALAAEARTLAVRESGMPSQRSGAPASGTGTDCIVVACPPGDGAPYAGKHTAAGHVVGAAVHAAVRAGVDAWLAERRP